MLYILRTFDFYFEYAALRAKISQVLFQSNFWLEDRESFYSVMHENVLMLHLF